MQIQCKLKLYGSDANTMKPIALINIPLVAIRLDPYLSDNIPEIGPMIIVPIISGNM